MKKHTRSTPRKAKPSPRRSVALEVRGARAAEVLPALSPLSAIPAMLSNEPAMMASFVGTLKLTDEQIKALRRPVEDDEIDWKPAVKDGPEIIPYLSHNGYRDRLDAAFGLGGWGMFQTGIQRKEGNDFIYIPFALIIDGLPRIYAWGEQQLHKMTLGDALEGAKSNAIVRCGKELGIARELWNKKFVQYLQQRRNRPRQEQPTSGGEAPQPRAVHQPTSTATITEKQQSRFFAIARAAGRTKPELAVWLASRWNVRATANILQQHYNAIVMEVEKPGPLSPTPAFAFEGEA